MAKLDSKTAVKTCMAFDRSQWLRVRHISVEQGIPAAQIVRDALAAYLRKIEGSRRARSVTPCCKGESNDKDKEQ